MKTPAKSFIRSMLLVLCAFPPATPHFNLAPSAFAQSGGTYTINPSVTSGGGGVSTNGNIRIEGSIGQSVLGTSSAASFSIDSGFWPNAVSCPSALFPLSQFFATSGGSGSVNVIALSSCDWMATASETWITITSADSGTGNDVVTYEVRENFTASARQAYISISGSNQLIVQDGGLGEDCGYFVNPGFQSFSANGGSGTIDVLASDRCAWQAVASVSWVTITSLDVGIGSGAVSYTVGQNPGAGGRKGTIIIGGQVFAVKQKGS
jgi:hypothetical protein